MDLAIQLLAKVTEIITLPSGERLRPARPCPRCLRDNVAGIIEGGGCSETISTEDYDRGLASGEYFSGREQPTHYRLANGEFLTVEERRRLYKALAGTNISIMRKTMFVGVDAFVAI
jgi:hypothetical protein